MDKDTLEKIVALGAQAPSGDNSQPWKFSYADETLHITVFPEKDHPILNVDAGGTLIALGALLYNLTAAAQYHGYTATTNRLTSTTATVTFMKAEGRTEPLYQYDGCLKRHTNRKPYTKEPLPNAFYDEAKQAFALKSKPRVQFVTDTEQITTLAKVASTMERIALSTKELHAIFFGGIFWSQADNDAGRHGLYIKTMELPSPAQLIFKVLRYWPVAKVLAAVGFPKTVAATNSELYASGPALGVIFADIAHGSDTYIDTGFVFEHVWATAAKHDIAMQPIAGILYLMKYLEQHPDQTMISDEHVALLQAKRQEICDTLGSTELPLMMFRLGYAQEPTAISGRKTPVIEYT